uniref:Uncharacterized protein n=1 Tax=Anguilla anguilla TaxID=7936 RepID=A0A0E9WNY9_ANGAN
MCEVINNWDSAVVKDTQHWRETGLSYMSQSDCNGICQNSLCRSPLRVTDFRLLTSDKTISCSFSV